MESSSSGHVIKALLSSQLKHLPVSPPLSQTPQTPGGRFRDVGKSSAPVRQVSGSFPHAAAAEMASPAPSLSNPCPSGNRSPRTSSHLANHMAVRSHCVSRRVCLKVVACNSLKRTCSRWEEQEVCEEPLLLPFSGRLVTDRSWDVELKV